MGPEVLRATKAVPVVVYLAGKDIPTNGIRRTPCIGRKKRSTMHVVWSAFSMRG
jgi:hypothetical protein